MKIPRRLLKDPQPELTAKMRRAARALGKAVGLSGIALLTTAGAKATLGPEPEDPNVRIGRFRYCAACNTPPGSPTLCADCLARQTAFFRGDDSAALPAELPDPVCIKACGGCWACLRKAGGPDWYLANAVWPEQPPAARARAPKGKR